MIEGRWKATVAGSKKKPQIRAYVNDTEITDVSVEKDDPDWTVIVHLPMLVLTDGVHSVRVFDDQETNLAAFSIITGDAATFDLRGEVAILRGELDMLKKAIRETLR